MNSPFFCNFRNIVFAKKAQVSAYLKTESCAITDILRFPHPIMEQEMFIPPPLPEHLCPERMPLKLQKLRQISPTDALKIPFPIRNTGMGLSLSPGFLSLPECLSSPSLATSFGSLGFCHHGYWWHLWSFRHSCHHKRFCGSSFDLASFQAFLRTWSIASTAHCTTWKGSIQSFALGQYSLILYLAHYGNISIL